MKETSFYICLMIFVQSSLQAQLSPSLIETFNRSYVDNESFDNHVVIASFRLNGLVKDKAMENEYFPPLKNNGKPFAWKESSAIGHGSYISKVEIEGSPGVKPSVMMRHKYRDESFSYKSNNDNVLRFEGVSRTTTIPDDYYHNMIGFSTSPIQAPLRNMEADLKTVFFNLSDIIKSPDYIDKGEVVRNKVKCRLIENPRQDKVWLSMEHGLALAQREWNWPSSNILKRRVRVKDYRKQDEIWFPVKVEMEIYGHPTTAPNKLVGRLECDVQEIKTNIPESYFAPSFPPDTVVMDMSTGQQFVFGQEKQKTDELIQQAKTISPAFKKRSRFSANKVFLFLIPGLAGLLFFLKRKRNL